MIKKKTRVYFLDYFSCILGGSKVSNRFVDRHVWRSYLFTSVSTYINQFYYKFY